MRLFDAGILDGSRTIEGVKRCAMIDEIQVENLALIREATLVPARGLTVLTGETGAGKTALLSALKLLMGARADKDAVRDGEEALAVADGVLVGARAHEQLQRREQRRLARTRLAREHGQPLSLIHI